MKTRSEARKKLNKRQPFWEYFKERTKSNWFVFILLVTYLAFCIGSFIYFVTISDVRNYCACLIGMLLIPVFYMAEWTMRIKIPVVFSIILTVFMYGNVAGACYNLYTHIPQCDDILHALWGIVFMVFGFAVIKSLMGEPQNKKQFFTYLLFSFCITMASALLWEILEFTLDSLTGNFDMQEDTYVDHIWSYLLWPGYDHLNVYHIDGIDYTILYNAEGEEIYRFDEGYLDLGIIDTMWDIIWCTVAALGLFIILAFDWCLDKNKWIYRLLIPSLTVPAGQSKGQAEQPVVFDVSVIGEAAVAETLSARPDIPIDSIIQSLIDGAEEPTAQSDEPMSEDCDIDFVPTVGGEIAEIPDVGEEDKEGKN